MMTLIIEHGVLYVDQVRFSFVGAGHGSTDIQSGRYEVEARFSHHHGKTLPHADGLGWLGADDSCAVVVGKVRSRDAVIASGDMVSRLVTCIETCEEIGRGVVLEVKP